MGDLVEDIVVWPRGRLRVGADTESVVRRRRGGSAANVAAFVAATGTGSRFVGQVGDDAVGERLVASLRADGVDARVLGHGATGTVVAIVSAGGERSMLTDRGASTQLAAVPADVLDGVEVLHVPAYSFAVEPLATTSLDLVGDAVARGVRVTLDASSVTVLEDFGPGEFRALVAQVRPAVLFCNRDEAVALGVGRRGAVPGARVTIVRAGSRPTVAVRSDGASFSVPVPAVEGVVDTTGAGDAFAAGFLVSQCRGAGARASIEAAHELAASVIVAPGASRRARGAEPEEAAP